MICLNYSYIGIFLYIGLKYSNFDNESFNKPNKRKQLNANLNDVFSQVRHNTKVATKAFQYVEQC